MCSKASEERAEYMFLESTPLRILLFSKVLSLYIGVDLKIKSVISIAESGFLVNKSDEIVNYMYIPAEDHEFYDIKQHFDETFQFI